MCVAQRTSLGGATASTIAGRGERARAMARRALRAATLLCAVGRLSAQTTTVESGVSAVTERVKIPGHPDVPGHKTWRLYADTAKCSICYNLYKLYGEPGVSRGAGNALGWGCAAANEHRTRIACLQAPITLPPAWNIEHDAKNDPCVPGRPGTPRRLHATEFLNHCRHYCHVDGRDSGHRKCVQLCRRRTAHTNAHRSDDGARRYASLGGTVGCVKAEYFPYDKKLRFDSFVTIGAS